MTDDLLSRFDDVEPAPKQPTRKGKLDARTLTTEIALGTLQLILDGQEATPDEVKRIRPTLSAAYTERYSTLPSYMGSGRSKDGVNLYRNPKTKAYGAWRENGALCLRTLARHGYGLDAAAEELGLADADDLIAKVDAMPSKEEVSNG